MGAPRGLGAAVCAHGNLRASTGGSRSFDVAISEGTFVVRKDTAAHFNHPVYAPQKPNSPGTDNGGLQTAPGRAPLEPPGCAATPAFYAAKALLFPRETPASWHQMTKQALAHQSPFHVGTWLLRWVGEGQVIPP